VTGSVAPEPQQVVQPGAIRVEAIERLDQAVKDNLETSRSNRLWSPDSHAKFRRWSGCSESWESHTKKRYVILTRTSLASKPKEMSGTKNRSASILIDWFSGRKQRQYVDTSRLWPLTVQQS